MELSGQIQIIKGRQRFIPDINGESFNRLKKKQKDILLHQCKSLTDSNYRIKDPKLHSEDGILHVKEPDKGEQKGFKVLDVGPIHHIDEIALEEINGLSDKRNTAGVFFKPNLSTQQSPPPTSIRPTKRGYWQTRDKQTNVQNNRDHLKPLYIQAKEFHQQKIKNPMKIKTDEDERNFDLLRDENQEQLRILHTDKSGEVCLFSLRFLCSYISFKSSSFYLTCFVLSCSFFVVETGTIKRN